MLRNIWTKDVVSTYIWTRTIQTFVHVPVSLQEVSCYLDGAPMDSAPIDGLPLYSAPVDDLDGCPLGWDPLDGVPVDDIDGVPLGVAIDDIDGMPCESTTYQKHIFQPEVHHFLFLLSIICPAQVSWINTQSIHPLMGCCL